MLTDVVGLGTDHRLEFSEGIELRELSLVLEDQRECGPAFSCGLLERTLPSSDIRLRSIGLPPARRP